MARTVSYDQLRVSVFDTIPWSGPASQVSPEGTRGSLAVKTVPLMFRWTAASGIRGVKAPGPGAAGVSIVGTAPAQKSLSCSACVELREPGEISFSLQNTSAGPASISSVEVERL